MQVKDIEPIVLKDLAAQPGPRHATNGIKFHSAPKRQRFKQIRYDGSERRSEIARALLGRARVLFRDEPTLWSRDQTGLCSSGARFALFRSSG